MTNYAQNAHSATGAAVNRMDAGAGNTFGQFSLRVCSNAADSVVALETSPDNTTYTEVARCTGDRWATARSDARARWARANVISLGTGGAPISTNVCSFP
jgi:hypothetical protein